MTSGGGTVLPQCKEIQGSGLWLDVADYCAELWILHSGGAVGGCHSTHWDVDDPQDLRLCVDGTDWIFRYETALPCNWIDFAPESWYTYTVTA